jgi:hypothetical protein
LSLADALALCSNLDIQITDCQNVDKIRANVNIIWTLLASKLPDWANFRPKNVRPIGDSLYWAVSLIQEAAHIFSTFKVID